MRCTNSGRRIRAGARAIIIIIVDGDISLWIFGVTPVPSGQVVFNFLHAPHLRLQFRRQRLPFRLPLSRIYTPNPIISTPTQEHHETKNSITTFMPPTPIHSTKPTHAHKKTPDQSTRQLQIQNQKELTHLAAANCSENEPNFPTVFKLSLQQITPHYEKSSDCVQL